MRNLAPIVLFIYNRPDHTRRTLAALAANPLAIDSDLIVYADGPKRPEHAASIAQARDAARSASGFKSVRLIERDGNLGLAKSIITGVSDVCSERGRAIILEDDLLVAPQFLTFINKGLDCYADRPEVFQISGYMFPVATRRSSEALFLAGCFQSSLRTG
jgi:GT2 family glycosyltransferase